MIKIAIKSLLILALLIVGVSAYAQEDDTTVTSEVEVVSDTEITIEDEGEQEIDEEDTEGTEVTEVTEDTEENDSELTEEQVEEIIESTEEIQEEDIEDASDLEGEVVAVTDDVVIIETSSGEVITVSKAAYETSTYRGSSASGRRKAALGQKIATGTVKKNDDGMHTVTTVWGTRDITSNVSVTRNGNPSSIDEVEEDDEAVAIFDKDGNLVAVDFIGDIEKASQKLLFGSIIAIIIILALAGLFRSKKKKEVQTKA